MIQPGRRDAGVWVWRDVTGSGEAVGLAPTGVTALRALMEQRQQPAAHYIALVDDTDGHLLAAGWWQLWESDRGTNSADVRSKVLDADVPASFYRGVSDVSLGPWRGFAIHDFLAVPADPNRLGERVGIMVDHVGRDSTWQLDISTSNLGVFDDGLRIARQLTRRLLPGAT